MGWLAEGQGKGSALVCGWLVGRLAPRQMGARAGGQQMAVAVVCLLVHLPRAPAPGQVTWALPLAHCFAARPPTPQLNGRTCSSPSSAPRWRCPSCSSSPAATSPPSSPKWAATGTWHFCCLQLAAIPATCPLALATNALVCLVIRQPAQLCIPCSAGQPAFGCRPLTRKRCTRRGPVLTHGATAPRAGGPGRRS